MRKVFLFALFASFAVNLLPAQTVAVPDFQASDPALQSEMTAITDVFRAELMKKSLVDLADGTDNKAPYIITGTVTRFGDWSGPAETVSQMDTGIKASSIILPLALSAIPGVGILSSLVRVFGMVGTVGAANKAAAGAAEQGAAAQEAKQNSRHITVSASMKERASGRVMASASLDCRNYTDYTTGMPDFANRFIARMPLPDAMRGATWTGTLEHDGFVDDYSLTLGRGNKCALTVVSTNTQGITYTQSAEGRYRYNEGILTVSVDFRNRATITWLTKVDWRFMASLAADTDSWNGVVPVSSAAGARQMRITFWREE